MEIYPNISLGIPQEALSEVSLEVLTKVPRISSGSFSRTSHESPLQIPPLGVLSKVSLGVPMKVSLGIPPEVLVEVPPKAPLRVLPEVFLVVPMEVPL